jgi:hypothetical protein
VVIEHSITALPVSSTDARIDAWCPVPARSSST